MNDVKVIIDVGAKETNYPIEYPEATCYLFEPKLDNYKKLLERFESNKNVHIFNYGLGESIKDSYFNIYLEAFVEGGANRPGWGGDISLPIKTLDKFIEEFYIDRIDFLKIDTEGYDINVLQGGMKSVALTRYLQFEVWDNLGAISGLLPDFDIKDIGARNYFCTRHGGKD